MGMDLNDPQTIFTVITNSLGETGTSNALNSQLVMQNYTSSSAALLAIVDDEVFGV